MEHPTKLYHYTSINNLAYILKSNKIKFSRLDQVNDLTEAGTSDMGNVGQYYFVSCWTDLEEESLPFWNMYTNMIGVRIELSYPIIKTHKIDGSIVLGNSSFLHFNKKTYLATVPEFPIQKVIYNKNKEIYNPSFWIKGHNEYLDEEYLDINDNVGMLKHDVWEFESEWRYRIMLIPTRKETLTDKEKSFKITAPYISKSKNSVKVNELFFELNDDTFRNMRIVLAPKCNESDFIIVEALLKQYNKTAKLEWSDLRGRVK